MYRRLISIAAILSVVLAWEVVGRMGFVHISLFPPPSHVFTAFGEMYVAGELVRDIKASIWRAIAGLAIGGAFGVVVGLATGRIAILNSIFSPIIQIVRPLPPVAIIPLVIVWAGIGEFSKLFSISFAVFFPVWINAHLGAKQIPKQYLWSAGSLKVTTARLFYDVVFPGALPFIVAGVRNGIAIAFVMVFVSELAGASSGIGYQISVSHLAYRIDRMIASLIVLGLSGAFADYLFVCSTKLVFPWLKLSEGA